MPKPAPDKGRPQTPTERALMPADAAPPALPLPLPPPVLVAPALRASEIRGHYFLLAGVSTIELMRE